MEKLVYGKTMENLRNRIDVTLANDEKYYLKWALKTKLYGAKKYLITI